MDKASDYGSEEWGFDSLWTRLTISSSAAEQLPYKQPSGGSSPP